MMYQIKTLSTLLMLTASFISVGQTRPDLQEEAPFIEVIGTAEQEIIPDEIYISISILERQEGKDKITIEQQETALREGLQSISVQLENLTLSHVNANYIRVKWSKKDVIARNEYELKVKDALTVGKVFEIIDEIKIDYAHISKVSHSKLEKFKQETRILAIKAAKEKADYLLVAIDQETGKALKVYEDPSLMDANNLLANVRGVTMSGYSYESMDQDKMYSNYKSNTIQFEKITLQAAVYVKFEIK